MQYETLMEAENRQDNGSRSVTYGAFGTDRLRERDGKERGG